MSASVRLAERVLAARRPGVAPASRISGLRADADAAECVRWLAGHLRLYARDLAVWGTTGAISPAEAIEEIARAAGGAAAREGWPVAVGVAAAESAWGTAAEAARLFEVALRRRLWPLGRDRASGAAILVAAIAVEDEAGVWLPDKARLRAVRRIIIPAARSAPRGS